MISSAAFLAIAMQCANNIHPKTISALVKTESSFNPWAIGVVGGALKKQPNSKEEALRDISLLVSEGKNFSVGLTQVNRTHFDVKNPESMLDPCNNLKEGAVILSSCYARAIKNGFKGQDALLKSFSCYYSNNFSRGFKPESDGKSYVERIADNANQIKVPAIGDNEVSPEQRPTYQGSERVPVYQSWDVLRQYPHYETPSSGNDGEASQKQSNQHITDTKKEDDVNA